MSENQNKNLESFGYDQSLKRVMPLSSIILYGLAYMAPSAIFGTYGIVTTMTHGMLALTYATATFAMFFTALSYKQMVKAFPIAGSAYSYVQRSINPYIGFLAGWSILMDYMLIPMINYMFAGLFLNAAIPSIPVWATIIVLIAIVTIINYIGIVVTAWVNNVLVIIQVVFIVALVLFIVKLLLTGGGAGTLFDWNAVFNAVEFSKPGMGWEVILTGASILALSFLGFDAVTTIVEEAIEPEKNVGKAIIITCVGIGVYYFVVAYFFQRGWPMAWKEFASPDTGAYELVLKVSGTVMGYLFTAMTILGTTASATASQASASRILFGMGRDGVLPKKFFGYVQPKHKTPTYNIIFIGFVSLVALIIKLEVAVSLINFGALTGFMLVNLSVFSHYYIKNKKRALADTFKYMIFPFIGILVCGSIWWNLATDSKILGFSWLAVGAVYLAVTTNFFRKLPLDLKLE